MSQRQKAFALTLLMIGGCVLTLPLSATHIPRFDTFVLVADTARALLSLVVAFLLCAQVVVVRSPAVLMLSCGFLLVALTTLPQLLRVTQGDFVDPALRFVTDLALPLSVIAYALLRRGQNTLRLGGASLVWRGVTVTVALAAGATWFAASDAVTTPAPASLLLAAVCAIALALIARRRASVLDLWVQVAMTAWLIEVLLEALARDGTSFSWHLAQLYGVLAAACVAMALLAENASLHARLATVFARRARLRGEAHAERGSGGAVIDTLTDDINQPLCAITANADAIARMLDAPRPDLDEIRAALADISDDALRASDSMSAAQRLLQGVSEPPSVVDVGQLVADCLEQLRTEMRVHRVTCEVQTSAHLPGIRGFRRQLLQLLTHLVTNSLEAMSGLQTGERRLRVRTSHENRAVAIWVEDSGVGIRPENLGRVFEPYYTTKPHRAGLGLAVCRSIVVAHGGHISVVPGAAGGAAFQVILPVVS